MAENRGRRKVLIAVDGSEHGDRAFDCKLMIYICRKICWQLFHFKFPRALFTFHGRISVRNSKNRSSSQRESTVVGSLTEKKNLYWSCGGKFYFLPMGTNVQNLSQTNSSRLQTKYIMIIEKSQKGKKKITDWVFFCNRSNESFYIMTIWSFALLEIPFSASRNLYLVSLHITY